MNIDLDAAMLRFFKDDLRGNRVTNAAGEVLYEDDKSSFVSRERTNWSSACPPPRVNQRGEMWDLICRGDRRTYMVTTSTIVENGETLQIHHIEDASIYMSLVQDITDYSKIMREEKEHDSLTGLYNKGKFMELKRTLFRAQDSITVFNMDVNNLKTMNDTFGHEAGDRLLRKAAESLRAIEARNVLPFRVGGDEFIVVALHLSLDRAEELRQTWEAGLAQLNQRQDGIECVIACGMAHAEKGYDLDAVQAMADQRMYEDKKAKKLERGEPMR